MGININVTDKEVGLREDLADILTNITPDDTPFISSIGRTKASNVKTEWLTDTLSDAASAGANALDEGFSATNTSAGVPTRLTNYTQIFGKFVMVSESEIASNPAGRSDIYQYTLQKRTKEIARDIEAACILQSAQSSGEASAGTGRLLAGLGLGGYPGTSGSSGSNAGWISANYYIGTALGLTADGNNGVSAGSARFNLTETLLNNVLQIIWDQSGEMSNNIVFVNGYQKRVISSFSGNGTRFNSVPYTDKVLNSAVDLYYSDFGTVQLRLNRYMNATKLGVINPSYFKLGELRPLNFKPLAKDGDRERGQLVYEASLVAYAPRSGGKIQQLASALGATVSD